MDPGLPLAASRSAIVRTSTLGANGTDSFQDVVITDDYYALSNGNYYVIGDAKITAGQVTFRHVQIEANIQRVEISNIAEPIPVLGETNPGTDIIVQKLDTNGTPIWTTQLSTVGGDELFPVEATAVAVNADGDVFLLTTEATALTTNGNLHKLDGKTGESIWPFGVRVRGNLRALAVDPDGNVVVTGNRPQGSSNRAASFAAASFDEEGSHGSPPLFICTLAKYDGETGDAMWGSDPDDEEDDTIDLNTPIGDVGGTRALEVQTDRDGNIVVGGLFAGAADFGSGAFDSEGSGDLFLVGYRPDGQFVWAKQIPIALEGSYTGLGIASGGLAEGGRVTIGGVYQGSMVADGSLLINSVPELTQHQDLFLTSFVAPCMRIGCDSVPPTVGSDPTGDGDSPGPLDTLQNDMTLHATGPDGAAAWWALPTAIDVKSGGTNVICDPRAGHGVPDRQLAGHLHRLRRARQRVAAADVHDHRARRSAAAGVPGRLGHRRSAKRRGRERRLPAADGVRSGRRRVDQRDRLRAGTRRALPDRREPGPVHGGRQRRQRGARRALRSRDRSERHRAAATRATAG